MIRFSNYNKELLSLAVATLLLGCGSSDSSISADTTSNESDGVVTSVTTQVDKFSVVDTNQVKCFDSMGAITTCANSGQDAEYSKNAPSYTDNADETITDNVTSLTWQKTADINGNGSITDDDKMTQAVAESYCSILELGGHSDWRLPDIKTIYSIMDFSGTDPSGFTGTDTSGLTPFVDTNYFGFDYSDGARIIDVQYATTSFYVANTSMLFGLNLADGRIKGYGLTLFGQDKTFNVRCVRGEEEYGKNNYTDNNDSTITDNATNLMWQQNDNAVAVNWDGTISYCENLALAGHDDWKLPDAKELHSVVDYSRSPDTTSSPAINAIFNSTGITNEAGTSDFGAYWSSTTHETFDNNGSFAVYVSFGRAMGYENSAWSDVHGAGAQRSDPKDISLVTAGGAGDDAYNVVTDANGNSAITHGPQGDVLRGLNFARCVRNTN